MLAQEYAGYLRSQAGVSHIRTVTNPCHLLFYSSSPVERGWAPALLPNGPQPFEQRAGHSYGQVGMEKRTRGRTNTKAFLVSCTDGLV